MFDHYCTACEKRSLVFPSQIVSMANTAHGIEVAFTCWCGAARTWTTGKAAEGPQQTLVAA